MLTVICRFEFFDQRRVRTAFLDRGGSAERTLAEVPSETVRRGGDLEEIDALARENLRFLPCKEASEALSAALLPFERPVKKEPVLQEEPASPLHIPAKPTQPAAHCSESRN